MSALLSIKNVVKDFKNLRAVDHVSFDLQPGEVFGLLGANGAGKTTLISCIVNLLQHDSGSITVHGHDILKEPKKCLQYIGFVPQELINYGYFCVEDVLKFYTGYHGVKPDKERQNYILNLVGLYEKRRAKVRQLSGGMKRRLLIARSLLASPEILLLDEPTAGVDVELRQNIWKLVEELRKENLSILLTTHYLEEAERLCDRVAIIHEGQLKVVDKTKDLIARTTVRKVSFQLKTGQLPSDKVKKMGDSYFFTFPMSMGLGEAFQKYDLKLEDIKDIKITEGTLEEAFQNTLGNN